MLKRIKRYYRRRPLSWKISFLHCMIILVVVAVLVIAISRIASGILIEQKTENLMKDLFAISEKMDMLFSGYERDSRAIIVNQRYQDMLFLEEDLSEGESALRSLRIALALADFYSSYTKIQEIRLYDMARQKVIANYPTKPDHAIPPLWDEVNRFVEDRDAYRWTDFLLIENRGAFVSLLHRVNNYNGKFIGVLELAISENQINRMYRDFESGDMRFYLLDAAGRIVSATDKGELGGQLFEDSAFLDVAGGKNQGEEMRIGDVPCLVISKAYERLGYQLVGTVSKQAIIQDVNLLVWIIILIGAAGILISSILVRWTSKRSTYPLGRIISVIDSVSHGNYAARVELSVDEELRALGLQLNEMIDNMVGMMDQIRRQSEQKRMYELQNLQMQMNPHFLYNSLETVCGIIDAGDTALAIRMVNDISRFYRGVLSGGNAMVTVEQEIRITKRYLEIVRTRYKDSFGVDVKIQSEVLPMEIPKLILQPLVENSVVHGFIGRKGRSKLFIHGCIQGGKRIISISDNGCGIKPEKLERIMAPEHREVYQGGGFGLRSIDERIKLVFGEPYGLRIWSLPNVGTRVSLILPLGQGGETR